MRWISLRSICSLMCRPPGEIVTHGTTGWLVAPDDAGALERGLRALLDDGELRARLAQAGAASVDRFAINRIVARYAALLEAVMIVQ